MSQLRVTGVTPFTGQKGPAWEGGYRAPMGDPLAGSYQVSSTSGTTSRASRRNRRVTTSRYHGGN